MGVSTKSVAIEPREMFDAKNIVASKTANPDSAQFDKLSAYELGNGDRIYCGHMDAAVDTGARTGFVPFYIRTRGGIVKSVHYAVGSAEFASKKCAEAGRGSIKISPH